jgi:hypothetical protein
MIRYLVSLALAAALTVAPVRAAVIFINPYMSAVSYVNKDVFEIVTALGETANLQFCLDAGDSTSYDGTSQTWVDLSGNTQNFFRGTLVSAQASDPTFNGVAGALSTAEYFSYDGGDVNEYDSANETWMNNLHKDNAAFSFMFWFYADTLGTNQHLAGTIGNTASRFGVKVRVTTSGYISLQVFDGDAGGTATVLDQDTSAETTPVTENAWNFVAVSINEATGTDGLIFNVNGTNVLDDSTYTSPDTSAASARLQIGSSGNAVLPLLATSRLAMVCAWDRALTGASLTALEAATDDRGF